MKNIGQIKDETSGCALIEFEIKKIHAVKMERNELVKIVKGITVEKKIIITYKFFQGYICQTQNEKGLYVKAWNR